MVISSSGMALPAPSLQEAVSYSVRADGQGVSPIGFHCVLDQALVVVLVKNADRANLTRVLAATCPEFICLRRIEAYIANVAPPSLEDPILLFTEAYRKANTQDSKKRLLDVLKRAFKGLVPTGGEPSAYVARCEQWYRNNKEVLSVDPEYDFNLHIYFGHELPLFKVKR